MAGEAIQEYPMHECVFRGDKKELSKLLRTHDVTQKDKHGMLKNKDA